MPIPVGNSSTQNRVLLRDMVCTQIKDAILDGTLRPGESLHDVDLKRWLGVSRTPIRDAINELIQMGLIDLISNRHIRVSTVSEKTALESFEALGVLFSAAIRLSFSNISHVEFTQINTNIEKLIEMTKTGSFRKIRDEILPVFAPYLEHSTNNQFNNLSQNSIDGLFYKLRSEKLLPYIDLEKICLNLNLLKEANIQCNVHQAQEVVREMFQVKPIT